MQPYKIEKSIGKGSFSEVYLARNQEGTAYAIKKINFRKLNKKLLRNLYLEIHILYTYYHKNIIKLHDVYVQQDEHLMLVMDFCSLGDLQRFMTELRLFPNKDLLLSSLGGLRPFAVKHLLRQIADALNFLHSHNIIHRDLKPQNILLLPGPEHDFTDQLKPHSNGINPEALPLLKLADFGFARSLPDHSLASTLCGSPLYMAPEILRGEKYDSKTDLWSLGTILYELVYARPPFKANNHIDLLRKIERGDGIIRFPDEVVPQRMTAEERVVSSLATGDLQVPVELRDLIRKLLTRNPNERISFEEFFGHSFLIGSNESPRAIDIPSSQRHYQPLQSTYTVSPPRNAHYMASLPMRHKTLPPVGKYSSSLSPIGAGVYHQPRDYQTSLPVKAHQLPPETESKDFGERQFLELIHRLNAKCRSTGLDSPKQRRPSQQMEKTKFKMSNFIPFARGTSNQQLPASPKLLPAEDPDEYVFVERQVPVQVLRPTQEQITQGITNVSPVMDDTFHDIHAHYNSLLDCINRAYILHSQVPVGHRFSVLCYALKLWSHCFDICQSLYDKIARVKREFPAVQLNKALLYINEGYAMALDEALTLSNEVEFKKPAKHVYSYALSVVAEAASLEKQDHYASAEKSYKLGHDLLDGLLAIRNCVDDEDHGVFCEADDFYVELEQVMTRVLGRIDLCRSRLPLSNIKHPH